MDIVKAVWENRNLGVDAYEFKLSVADLDDMPNIIKQVTASKYDNAYLTLKMPVGNLKALHDLEDVGFRFMETQLHMTKSLTNYETPKLISRLKNELVQKEVEKNETNWKSVLDLMSDDAFHTDRIYLDPKLKAGTSRIRYYNWVMDLVHEPEAHLFTYHKQDAIVGFGLTKINEKTKIVHDLLESVFNNYQNTGLGLLMFDMALKSYQARGFKKLITSISSNNPAIINLDLIFGYSIACQEYVLRKFNTGES